MKEPWDDQWTLDMRCLLALLVGFWLFTAILMGCDGQSPKRLGHPFDTRSQETKRKPAAKRKSLPWSINPANPRATYRRRR